MIRTRMAAFCVCMSLVVVEDAARANAQLDRVITDAESYAVFAAAFDAHGPGPIAILQETRAVAACSSGASVPPEWIRVVANYETENARIRTLRSDADFGRPYSLVSFATLQSLMRRAGYPEEYFSGAPLADGRIEQSPGHAVFGRFPGRKLHAVSAVGFNADRTLAMVTVQEDCFPMNLSSPIQLCHGGVQMLLEKHNGRWSVAPGGCRWIA